MDIEHFRPSQNVELDCLGTRAGANDANFGAVQRCFEEVNQVRQQGTASNDAGDMGVVKMRDGILQNLADNNIGAVEKFLQNPKLDNIPQGGEELTRANQVGWMQPPAAENSSGLHLNPQIKEPLEKMERGVSQFITRLRGYDTSPEHKADLVRQTDDFLKSPSGNDLVLKYDHENGPT